MIEENHLNNRILSDLAPVAAQKAVAYIRRQKLKAIASMPGCIQNSLDTEFRMRVSRPFEKRQKPNITNCITKN
jgi:hypothetical protein